MIGYVKGMVSHMFADYCFMDVQGVGYRVFIPESTRQKLTVGQASMLFTYLQVREDAMQLYGFFSQDEYDLFLLLLTITGIGPKVALGILSGVNPEGFRLAIAQKNTAVLTKIPGVGKKTAERIILELKDKIHLSDSEGGNLITSEKDLGMVLTASGGSEALQALVSLGYNQNEVLPILRKIDDGTQPVEALIKMVLKEISRM